MLGPHAAVCFKRLQGLDPFDELRPGFVQAIPRERRALHFKRVIPTNSASSFMGSPIQAVDISALE